MFLEGILDNERFIALQQAFMHEMFHPDNHSFFWPSSLNKEEWQNECLDILNTIHHNYFAHRLSLAHSERQDFIELAYAEFIQRVAGHVKAASCNLSCKLSFERGPSSYTLLYLSQFSAAKPMTLPEVNKLIAMLFGPAVLMGKRMPCAIYSNRMESAAKYFVNPLHYKKYAADCLKQDISLLGNRGKLIEQQIIEYIDKKQIKLPEKYREDYIQKTLASYARSSHYFAPVVKQWVSYLLDKAQAEGKKIVFMARDGTTPYKLAKKMLKQPNAQQNYPDLKEDHIMLGYFSRKIIESCEKNQEEGKQLFQDYVKQLGIEEQDKCLFVDVGFGGSMIDAIRNLLAPLGIQADFEFLISSTPKAKGFVPLKTETVPANPQLGRFNAVDIRSDNLEARFWLEDPHQGSVKSPTQLVRRVDGIYPNTLLPFSQQTYHNEPANYLMRKWSQKAVFSDLQESTTDLEPQIKLNDFLINIEKKSLPAYVSHIGLVS